ncbi:MAG: alkaline phosphatase PhoX, partial [Vulcanococcus sp.]
MNRRSLLELLGLAAASATATATLPSGSAQPAPPPHRWPSLLGPIPLPSDGLTAKQQQDTYRRITLNDRLDVPTGYRSDVLLSWGDRLGSGAMGFNNDYLAFTSIDADRALLTINFEYITAETWCAGYAEAHGRTLPFAALEEALQANGDRQGANTAEANANLQAMAMQVAAAALQDLGVGVACLVRQSDGSWRHQGGPQERRIHGLSGLKEPSQQLRSSGPAAAVFRRTERQGYNDGLGDRVIGTFANCAGGQTPWGTVLSAEENFQTQVVE